MVQAPKMCALACWFDITDAAEAPVLQKRPAPLIAIAPPDLLMDIAGMTAGHILIVDDEPRVRTLLRRCFEAEGFTVCEAENGAQLRAELAQREVTLITLDLSLGSENGLDLAREIRREHSVPIIMLTGRGDTIDRVVGLEVGADDYLAKPFELRELIARVRAVLRRTEGGQRRPSSPSQSYQFEGWIFDLGRRSLTRESGESQDLTTSEFNLLEAFVKRPHRVLSRDDIMDLLKGQDWSPLDRSIDNLIARLRKKIETDAEHPRLIKTVRGAGYVFAADVRRRGMV
jgi:two-component system, OmpR family, response regulator